MSDYRKGDVVLVSFPAINEQGTTHAVRRPAVVVSNDERNARADVDDVLLVPLMGSSKGEVCEPTQVIVEALSPEGRKAGLRLDSMIDCSIVATIPKALLVSRYGSFPQKTIKRIDEAIRRGDGPDGLATAVIRNPSPGNNDRGVALPLPEATNVQPDADAETRNMVP